MADDEVYYGLEEARSGTHDLNALDFLFRRLMSGVWTVMPVQVMAVSVDNVVGPIGTVDIMPLIHQIDGNGKAQPHKIIYGASYMRVAAGTNAVIMDPQVNDIGLACFAQRDMSKVKANVASNVNPVAAVPDSRRTFAPSDAIYLYTILTLTSNPNQTPKQYIQFKEDSRTIGMTLSSDMCINLQAPYTSGSPTQYFHLNNDGTCVLVSGGANGTITVQAPDTNQQVILNKDGTMSLKSGTSITLTAPTINLNGAVVGNSTATFTGDVTGAGTHLHTHTHSGVTTGTGNTGAPN